MRQLFFKVLVLLFFSFGIITKAQATSDELQRLQLAYPDSIKAVSSSYIAWKDGTRMPVQGSSSFFNALMSKIYHLDNKYGALSREDILRDRFEPFFKKMYGGTANDVRKKLVTIYWMPKVFGKRYPLKVTSVNGVDKKLQRVSAELEKLPRSYYKYLANTAGGFYWRTVARERYLSSHSFGIAMDINSHYTNYWMWDYLKSNRPFAEVAQRHHNRVPMKIVEIFEKEGFFWGGRWYFYDTMHFEYRPELVAQAGVRA